MGKRQGKEKTSSAKDAPDSIVLKPPIDIFCEQGAQTQEGSPGSAETAPPSMSEAQSLERPAGQQAGTAQLASPSTGAERQDSSAPPASPPTVSERQDDAEPSASSSAAAAVVGTTYGGERELRDQADPTQLQLPSLNIGLGIALFCAGIALAELYTFDTNMKNQFADIWCDCVALSVIWSVTHLVAIHRYILKKDKQANVFTPGQVALPFIVSVVWIGYANSYAHVGHAGDPTPVWMNQLIGPSLICLFGTHLAWVYKLGKYCMPKTPLFQVLRLLLFLVCLVLLPIIVIVWPLMSVGLFFFLNKSLSSGRSRKLGDLVGSKSLEGRDLVSLKYKVYPALQEWLKQRYSKHTFGSTKRSLKPFLAALSGLLLWACAIKVLTLTPATDWLRIKLTEWWNLAIGTANSQGHPAVINSVDYGNQIVVLSFGLSLLLAVALLYLHWLRQPNQIDIGRNGVRLCRSRKGKREQATFVEWSHLNRVDLALPRGKTNPSEGSLKFIRNDGTSLCLKLRCLYSVEDKELILKGIEKWAPSLTRGPDVIQALQPPANHSYTELWMQALAAPPKREKLKPLIDGGKVREGLYTVSHSIGVGGQGFAYLATDNLQGTAVVLKEFLLPVFVDAKVRKKALEKFENEARILKQLDHPQIVKLLDFFVEDHRAYLVLEYIDGLSMRKLVKKQGAMSEAQVRQLAQQMCSILEYLHGLSPPVVHRDFTPDNLILRKDGTLKVIDFNVAQQIESTATGSIVGKHAYLPPEQFRGNPVCQSDIYAMGATLYFLLTGTDPEPITQSHAKELCDHVSDEIDSIVARATATRLEDRYSAAAQVSQALATEGEKGSSAARVASDQGKPQAAAHHILGEPTVGTAAFSTTAPHLASQKTAPIDLKCTDDSPSLANILLDPPADFSPGQHLATESPGQSTKEGQPVVVAAPPLAVRRHARLGAIISKISTVLIYVPLLCLLLWIGSPPEWHCFMDPQYYQNKHVFWGKHYANRNERLALAEFNKAIAEDPNNSEAYAGRSDLLLRPGALQDKEKAFADQLKSTLLNPNDRTAQTNLMSTSLETHHYDQAVQACNRVIELDHLPDVRKMNLFARVWSVFSVAYVYHDLGLSELHLGRYEEALRHFAYAQQLLELPLPTSKLPNTLSNEVALAAAHGLAGHAESALQILNATLKRYQSYSDFEDDYPFAQAAQWGLEDANRSGSSVAFIAAGKAIGAIYANQPKLAEADLQEAIKIAPNCASLYSLLGHCYRLEGDSSRAQSMFEKADSVEVVESKSVAGHHLEKQKNLRMLLKKRKDLQEDR